jgi:hypothetical protein
MEKVRRPGCPECWPESAEAACEARKSSTPVRVIADDSHYRVVIEACAKCRQKFVYVMTELIDWADGEDPVCRQRSAITDAEATSLQKLDDIAAEDFVFQMCSDGRQCAVEDWPKGRDRMHFWAEGLRSRPHD